MDHSNHGPEQNHETNSLSGYHGGIPKSSNSWMTILVLKPMCDLGIHHSRKPPYDQTLHGFTSKYFENLRLELHARVRLMCKCHRAGTIWSFTIKSLLKHIHQRIGLMGNLQETIISLWLLTIKKKGGSCKLSCHSILWIQRSSNSKVNPYNPCHEPRQHTKSDPAIASPLVSCWRFLKNYEFRFVNLRKQSTS